MSGRFPFATLIGIGAGVFLAVSGEIVWAIVFFAIGAVAGALTLRSTR